MDNSKENYEVGVIVGRFQLAELHEAHQYLIETVIKNHSRCLVFLGVTKAIGTVENPIRIPSKENVLDYQSRLYMLQEKYPNIIISSLQDMDSNIDWSNNLDSKIREIFPTEKVLLYGGRDSFIPYYHGNFETTSLDPKMYVSATMERNKISKEVLKDPNFRKGQIYQAYQQTPILYTNYKTCISTENGFLFIKENGKLKLISGLASINDNSLEDGVKRTVSNVVGDIEINNIKYLKSENNNTFGNKTHKCINLLFIADKEFGRINPSKELCIVTYAELIKPNFMVKNFNKEDYSFIQEIIAQ